MSDQKPVLIINRKAQCERCGLTCMRRTIPIEPSHDKFMIYSTISKSLYCIPCAAALYGTSQKALVMRLRPPHAKLYPNLKNTQPHKVWKRGEDGKLHHVLNPELKRKRVK